MSIRHFITILAITGGAFSSASMAHTPPTQSWTRLDDVRLTSGWFQTENAAFLTEADTKQVSEASLYACAEQGDLANYFDSDEEFRFGVDAASLYRLTERVVVSGDVRYLNRTLRNATGSSLIDPTQTPFDLVELTTENAGKKRYEEYHITGRVGAQLGQRIAGGLSLSYTAANYAKYKDLRHINALMDMTVSAGVNYRIHPRLRIGANYTYRRRNESVQHSIYGKTDKTYYTLIDYGAFFGRNETFGTSGYTKENEAKPLFDAYHGGAVQVDWQIGNRWRWFFEAGYRTRDGFYGDDSPLTIIYAEHDGSQLSAQSIVAYRADRQDHTLYLQFEHRQLSNREKIYNYKQEESGLSYYEYIGLRNVGERTEEHFEARYTGRFGITSGLAAWQVEVTGTVDRRDRLATNYPDYRKQEITWWRLAAEVERNLLRGSNCYTITLGGGYGSGSGAPCTDGRYSSSNESATLTHTLDDRLIEEYEFLTNRQIRSAVGFRYNRLFGQKGVRAYIGVEYQYRKALQTTALGDACRQLLSLRVGCHF